MAIITMYPENMDKKQKYDLMTSPKIRKISECRGQTLDVVAFMIRDEANQDGEIREILAIQTAEGDLFATNSLTFIREFKKIIDCTEPPFSAEVVDGVSRAGRHFVTCAWV